VFSGIQYGRDGDSALLLDVRTPTKPGPFPVWVEWVEPGAEPLIVPDREVRSADTVLIRALMPVRAETRSDAARQLLSWLPHSTSGYGGDPERTIMIVRGAAGQTVLDLWKPVVGQPQTPRSVRALVLVKPPANLRGHGDWPDLPLLLIDEPQRSDALWRTALGLRSHGIAAEPSIEGALTSASPGLSTQIAAMLAASDVPRVQRFDQLAFDPPIALGGWLLDVVLNESGLVALFRDRRTRTVYLASIDQHGAMREIRRWSWRDDARLLKLGAAVMVLGSDAGGLPRAEFRLTAEGDWQMLPMQAPPGRLRLHTLAQREARGVVVAWSHTPRQRQAGSWLQRIEMFDGAPRIVGSRVIERGIRAVTFAANDAIVALGAVATAAPDSRPSSLWRWTSVDAWTPVPGADGTDWDALFSLATVDADVLSRPALLGERAGRLYSIDLSCRPLCLQEELDAAALGVGGVPGATRTAAASQQLQHPETGESLLALMPHARAARGLSPAALWLIRQRNGRYGIARLPDVAGRRSDALRAILPWPGSQQRHRYALFAGNQGRTLLFPARLQRADVMPGLWWDRTRSGHGFDLRRSGEGWQMTVYTFDERGAPVWYRGNGELGEGRWQPDLEGLLSYRFARGRGAVEIDRRSVQGLEIVFAEGEVDGDGSCSTTSRPGAAALARTSLVIGELRSEFCIEPLRLAAAGRPAIDADGVWSLRDEQAPWQLSLTTQGHDPLARISALLTYFDRNGAPRWAYAAGDWQGGTVDLQLLAVRGACATCAPRRPSSNPVGGLSLRVSGECGANRVNASLRISGEAGGAGIPQGPVELAPTALLGCY